MLSKKYILVNETFIVDHSITNKWAEWVSQNLLLELSMTGKIHNILLNRILTNHNPDGESYAIQFIVPEKNLEKILSNPSVQKSRNKMFNIFKDKIASFQTQMEMLDAKNMDYRFWNEK